MKNSILIYQTKKIIMLTLPGNYRTIRIDVNYYVEVFAQ